MDSSKFKKTENNAPKHRKRKNTQYKKNQNKKQNNNYKKNNYKQNKSYKQNKKQHRKNKNYNKKYNNNRYNSYQNDDINYIRSKYKNNKPEEKKDRSNLYAIIIILAFLAVIIALATGMMGRGVPEDAELVTPTQFSFTPYGYDWNKNLYGNFTAVDSNQTQSVYYLTLNQTAALASHSDETFNYSEGIYVTYVIDENSNIRIVDKLYDKNGNQIRKPSNYDEFKFSESARFIGMNNSFCAEGFGFTPEEYKDSYF